MKRSFQLGFLLLMFPVLLCAQGNLFFSANRADERGETDKAMSLYRQAIAQGDHVWESWNNLAVHYKKSGDLGSALSCIQNAMQIKPNQPNLFMTLGNIYKDGKLYGDARAAFSKAKDLGSKQAQVAIKQIDILEKRP